MMPEPENSTRKILETAADNRDAAVEIAKTARRSLVLFTHDMEAGVFDTPEFLETVKQLAISSRFARICILVKDPTRAVKDGHRLIELSRHLSSYISIRKPHADYRNLTETFLVADEHALLYRTLASRYDGIADTHDPVMARDKQKLFNTIWEKSEAEPEMRRLGI